MSVNSDYISKFNRGVQVVDKDFSDGILCCLLIGILTLCLIFVVFFATANAQVFRPAYYEKLADAIRIAEGGDKANQLYGINPKYVKCDSEESCRRVCINTIKSKEKEWINAPERDFLTYLSKRYCPFNHEIWLKNVKYYMEGII